MYNFCFETKPSRSIRWFTFTGTSTWNVERLYLWKNALLSHRTLFLHLFKLAMSTPVVDYSRPEERDGNMEDSAKEAVHEETVSAPQAYIIRTSGNKRAYITVLVLFVINLLNYMDRQTIAGRKNLYTAQPRKLSIFFDRWAIILRNT